MIIKLKDLKITIATINKLTNNPQMPWTRTGGRNAANVGNYHLSEAYGGYALYQMVSAGGGVQDTLKTGHVPKRELYNAMQALIAGLRAIPQSPNK